MKKINIGSNNIRIKDYLNIDGLDLENVDAIAELHLSPYLLKIKPQNLSKFDNCIILYPMGGENVHIFIENSIDEILAVEFLEHISFKNTDEVLKEWYRFLKPGGVIKVQVPDCGKAMEYYVNNEICDCVPHKGTYEQQIADPLCFACGGKAKINLIRWLFSFTGAQKHQYDAHLNIFTKDRLELVIAKAGFKNIQFTDDKFKLKVTAVK